MLPKNFPDRKNDRRLSALERLDKDSEAYKNTLTKIVNGARSIRSKKLRVGKAGRLF